MFDDDDDDDAAAMMADAHLFDILFFLSHLHSLAMISCSSGKFVTTLYLSVSLSDWLIDWDK